MKIATFESDCGRCDNPFVPGETEIIYHSVHGWTHADEEECGCDMDEEYFACVD